LTGRAETVVLDASAMVDLLVVPDRAASVREAVIDRAIHVPAHFDAEVLSALGRLGRAGAIDAGTVVDRLMRVVAAPFERHEVAPLLLGAWGRHERLRLVDAVYVQLAERLAIPLITSDRALAAAYPGALVP
jgi:predicted nucleic acid-binding protein